MSKISNYVDYIIILISAGLLILGFYDIFKHIYSGYIPRNTTPIKFLLSIIPFSFFFWYRGHKTYIISFLLFAAVLFYFYTYGWQYLKNTGFSTYITGIDCNSQELYNVYSYIDFYDRERARVYQDIDISTSNLSHQYLGFSMPDGLFSYSISMDSSYYDEKNRSDVNEILINETNSSSPEKYRSFLTLTKKNGHYKIKTSYLVENITPYGNFHFDFIGKDGCKPNIKDIYTSVIFSDISYECLPQCMKSFNENGTVGLFGGKVQYENYPFDKPSIYLSVSDKNVDKMSFRVQTVNKFFVMTRTLSLGIIAGLIVAFIRIIIDERSNYVSFIERIKDLFYLNVHSILTRLSFMKSEKDKKLWFDYYKNWVIGIISGLTVAIGTTLVYTKPSSYLDTILSNFVFVITLIILFFSGFFVVRYFEKGISNK